ncbi:MAG: NUDIX hydrolase, partial [Myxococcales bacterium]|nr:NUDIX hydrolase [Myxococcales bacterium]
MHRVNGLHVDGDDVIGRDGGFLGLRRLALRNRRDDGTLSAPYVCDFAVRPKGLDAVVVVVWHRAAGGAVQVLLRDGLRPPLAFGREPDRLVIPDRRSYLFLTEVVAGILEVGDVGDDGLRRRAAAEVLEEGGFVVDPAAVRLLGAGVFPSPGSLAEKFFLTAVEIADPAAQQPLPGDGSPMEEGASTRWQGLDAAIEACVRGEVEDAKTELALRR